MAINSSSGGNSLPAGILNVIEQQNYLETKLRRAIKPSRVLRASINDANVQWFDGEIGETKTFTRSNLITPNITPMNPALNTGLDNGITVDSRGFEQWIANLSQWYGGINLNLLGNETLIGDLWVDDLEKELQKAGDSLELVATARCFAAYDSGDTFVRVAVTSSTSTISVDNINGFTTQYASTLSPSYGLPQAVTTSNKLPVLIINGTTGAIKYAVNVQAFTQDATSVSYAQIGSIVIGNSGTLTFDALVNNLAIGDRVVAMDVNASTTAYNATYKDGSYVVRPLSGGSMITNPYQMAATNTLAPSVQFPLAASILRRRNVPRLANGLYGVAVDSSLLSYLYQDSGFQIATQGTWDRSPVFTNGIIAKGWGLEFIEDTQLPVYLAPSGAGFNLRHAFCFGADVISEHPFAKLRDARDKAAKAGDIVDVRFVDRIQMITQAPLDRMNEVVKISYKYVGDFQPGTDKGSNPNNVLTSDYCRFKRGVIVQAASSI